MNTDDQRTVEIRLLLRDQGSQVELFLFALSLQKGREAIMNICPICGEEYSEPPAISRLDNKTAICSSCGIRQSLEPLVKGGVVSEEEVEELVQKNREMYNAARG